VGDDQDQEIALPQMDGGSEGADHEGNEDAGDPLAEMTAGKDQQRDGGGDGTVQMSALGGT
jgi:hypothetical protein